MDDDPTWEEFADVSASLDRLVAEEARCSTASAYKTEISLEIARLTSRRAVLLAALCNGLST